MCHPVGVGVGNQLAAMFDKNQISLGTSALLVSYPVVFSFIEVLEEKKKIY